MNESPLLFASTFKLPRTERDPKGGRDLQFPYRSTNLHTRNYQKDDFEVRRYRSRNPFIMARHHMSSLLSNYYCQTQVSKAISQLWKNRKFAFDSYYRYLASLDARYLENFSNRNPPQKNVPKSYHKLCASTYCETSKPKMVFKVIKFQAKQARAPMRYNNEIFGLRIEDVLKSEV